MANRPIDLTDAQRRALRTARLAAGWSLDEMGRLAGCCRRTIQRGETTGLGIEADYLAAWCAALPGIEYTPPAPPEITYTGPPPAPAAKPLAASIRRRLIEARRQAGLTQIDLAAALGVSVATIAGYERGIRPVRPDFLGRWKKTLEITT
jgi:transcriptional regulator with XRE-family HTH domain